MESESRSSIHQTHTVAINLKWFNPFQIPVFYLSNIHHHFSCISMFIPLLMVPLRDDLQLKKIMYISRLSHTFETSVPSHLAWSNRTSSISCVSRLDGALTWIIRIIYILNFTICCMEV